MNSYLYESKEMELKNRLVIIFIQTNTIPRLHCTFQSIRIPTTAAADACMNLVPQLKNWQAGAGHCVVILDMKRIFSFARWIDFYPSAAAATIKVKCNVIKLFTGECISCSCCAADPSFIALLTPQGVNLLSMALHTFSLSPPLSPPLFRFIGSLIN